VDVVKVSKYLSKHLRHQPERLGLTLEPGGWVVVEDLLAACRRNHMPLTRSQLDEVVAKNDKQRFSFDETGAKIRANQGHSVEVDLQLEPTTPPDILYHGTGHNSVQGIREQGLLRFTRNHVHLSKDVPTAIRVGQRHGKPFVFVVDARAMHEAGHTFYVSDNGVWLAESIPAEYLRPLDE